MKRRRRIALGHGQLVGSELVTDGTFTLGISQVVPGRDAVLSWDGNNGLRITANVTAGPQGNITITTVAGRRYRITYDTVGTETGGTGVMQAVTGDGVTTLAQALPSVNTSGRTLDFTAAGTSTIIRMSGNFGGTNAIRFDNVSVKALT